MSAIASNVEVPRTITNRVAWVILPITLPLIVAPALILNYVEKQYLGGCFLAYINCLIGGWAIVHFIRHRTMEGLFPVLFLIWTLLSWPFATLFFAIVYPRMYYLDMWSREIPMLSGCVKMQLVTMSFLVTYVIMVCLLIRKPAVETQMITNRTAARRMGLLSLIIVTGMLSYNAFSRVVMLPRFLDYVAAGGMLYLNGLPLVIGALYVHLPRWMRISNFVVLLGFGFFYTLGNSRGTALFPMVMLFFGMLFCAELTQKWKITFLGCLIVAIPMYLVIGNTTRTLLSSIGFKDLQSRAEALSRWNEVVSDTPVLINSMGRIFMTGGHGIITQTPDPVPYIPFNPVNFSEEVFFNLIPRVIHNEPFYTSCFHLRRYGFNIVVDGNSVELSLIGSLWMMGGYLSVIIGAVVMGILHAILAVQLRNAAKVSPHKALIYMSLMAPTLLWTPNLDIISNFRIYVWRYLCCIIIYPLFVRPFLPNESSDAYSSGEQGHPAGAYEIAYQ